MLKSIAFRLASREYHELQSLRAEARLHAETCRVLRRDNPEAAEALKIAWYTAMEEGDAACRTGFE